jgi:hypothetical protein
VSIFFVGLGCSSSVSLDSSAVSKHNVSHDSCSWNVNTNDHHRQCPADTSKNKKLLSPGANHTHSASFSPWEYPTFMLIKTIISCHTRECTR